MKRIILFLIFLSMTGAILAAEIPQQVGRINDFAYVLTSEEKARINALISELDDKSSVEISLITVESIYPYDKNEYSGLIFENWRLGKESRDNGVLILLAVKDKKWGITAGKGIEGTLTKKLNSQILKQYMAPYFKKADYADGLYYGCAAIANIIAKDLNLNITNLEGVKLKKIKPQIPLFVYIFAPIFFFFWNIPMPFIFGLISTSFFIVILAFTWPLLSLLIFLSYLAAIFIKNNYWKRLPKKKREDFLGMHTYEYGRQTFASGGFSQAGHCGGFGGDIFQIYR